MAFIHIDLKILVISGIGVKEYYISKLNYKKDGIYVSKIYPKSL